MNRNSPRKVPPSIELAVLRSFAKGAKRISRRVAMPKYLARRISELEWEAEGWRSEWNRLGRAAQGLCSAEETQEREK